MSCVSLVPWPAPPHTSSSNFLMACTWIPAGRTKWTNSKFPSLLRVPDPKLCSYTTGYRYIHTVEDPRILYSYNTILLSFSFPRNACTPKSHARKRVRINEHCTEFDRDYNLNNLKFHLFYWKKKFLVWNNEKQRLFDSN